MITTAILAFAAAAPSEAALDLIGLEKVYDSLKSFSMSIGWSGSRTRYASHTGSLSWQKGDVFNLDILAPGGALTQRYACDGDQVSFTTSAGALATVQLKQKEPTPAWEVDAGAILGWLTVSRSASLFESRLRNGFYEAAYGSRTTWNGQPVVEIRVTIPSEPTRPPGAYLLNANKTRLLGMIYLDTEVRYENQQLVEN